MKCFFKLIDIYGTKFSFRINNHDNFKTYLGGFLTFLTISIVVIFAVFFGQDFYYGINPNIYTNTIVPEKYDSAVNLSPENFVFAWRIENYQKYMVNTTGLIYPITINFRLQRDEKGNLKVVHREVLPNVKCNPGNAKQKEFQVYINSDDWFCYDWTKGNYTFGGFFDGDYVDAFQTVLYVCEDGVPFSTTDKRCSNLEDYQKFETENMGLQISVLYPQFYLAADDLKNPLRLTYKNYYYYFNLKTAKIDRLFFNKVMIKDDQGWIFENIKESSLITYNRIQSDQNLNEIKDGTSSQFYEFNLYMEKSSQVIKRSFMKIQDVSAKVGGLIKILMIIFQFLNYFFSRHDFQISILSELFSFPQEEFEKVCKNEIKRSTYKLNEISNKEQGSILELKNQNLSINNKDLINQNKNTTNKISQKITNKKINDPYFNLRSESHPVIYSHSFLNKKPENSVDMKNLKFSSISRIKWILCKPNSKEEKKRLDIFIFMINCLKERLDLINFFKISNQVDKIKTVIFNCSQIKSFDIFSKPNIFNKEEIKMYGIQKKIDQKVVLNELIEYYKKKISSNNMNNYDNKLIHMLPDGMKYKIFQETNKA